MTRLRVIAALARAELLARGTPCSPLAVTDDLVRKQLAVWLALLRFERPVRVRRAATLVIPVVEKEEGDGKRTNGASAPGGRPGRRLG